MGAKKITTATLDDLVILAPHQYSEKLGRQVKRILKNDFGFTNINLIDSKKYYKIQKGKKEPGLISFDDQERGSALNTSVLKEMQGKYVSIIHETRVYDPNDRVASNPHVLTADFFHLLEKARDARAQRISWALPKTSHEWSHQFLKNLWKYDEHQAKALDQLIYNLTTHGLDTYINVHPHGPREGVWYANNYGLERFIEINPQTKDRVNGIAIEGNNMMLDLLKSTRHKKRKFKRLSSPFSYYLKILKGEIQDKNYFRDMFNEDIDQIEEVGNYKRETTFFVAPDFGAIPNTQDFAELHDYDYVISLKARTDEGQTTILHGADIQEIFKDREDININEKLYIPDLSKKLDKLAKTTKKTTLKFIIMDDKINSGGTANDEAALRRNQVQEWVTNYNKNKTENEHIEYNVEVELWATHLRQADLDQLKLYKEPEYINKIVLLDTVNYVPSLIEEIKKRNMEDRVRIIPAAAYQLAKGIAIDYLMHQNPNLDPTPFDLKVEKAKKRAYYDTLRPVGENPPHIPLKFKN
ncbi:hypothetical protein HOC11_06805 [archaeon]|nr:hypothetical protein [archaeon]